MDKNKNYLIDEADKYSLELIDKLNKLSKQLSAIIHDGIIVAFSGGTDSAMLVWAVKKVQDSVGGKVVAITQDSISLPRRDLDEAKNFCKNLGIKHETIEGSEFDDPRYIKNDSNRCYYCRSDLFKITDNIKKEGYKAVLYGYNHSDKGDFRPGHKAAVENDILSPLAEYEFTKDEIRLVLRSNKITIADKPASPCLSSRIMTGIAIEKSDVEKLEAMETILWEAGAKIFRVRLCKEETEKFLRIEASPDDIEVVIKNKDSLISKGKEFGYKWVTLDLEGYKLGGGTR